MKRLVLVGGGNMGEALVSGLLHSKQWKPSQITVTDVRPDQLERLKKTYKVTTSSDNRWAVRDADVVLLAVKPQHMKHVLQDLGPVIHQKQLVLSIAAGVSTEWIESFLAKGVPVIRVMPNTPALIQSGVAALARGRWATPAQEKTAQSIFSKVGTVVSVAEEEMDAVTALSGSGPAYVFYLAEAMDEAGRSLGLAPHTVDLLVRQTIRGSGMLLAQSHEEPHTLRQRVSSPGGTTEAAIAVFHEAGVQKTILKAITQACHRARDLSKLNEGGK